MLMSAPSEKSPERFSANQLDTIMKDAKNKFIKVKYPYHYLFFLKENLNYKNQSTDKFSRSEINGKKNVPWYYQESLIIT